MPVLSISYSNGNGMKEFLKLVEELTPIKLYYQIDKKGFNSHHIYFEYEGNIISLHHKGDPFEVAVRADVPIEMKDHEEISMIDEME